MSYDDDTNRITRLHDTIKELRAEIERLKADLAAGTARAQTLFADLAQARREIERLKWLMGDAATVPPQTSWFRYGWIEASLGAYVPPDGLLPRLLYWLGHRARRRGNERRSS